MKKMKYGRTVLELVFPRRCPVCDQPVAQPGEKICLQCLSKLRILTPPWCMKCGKKLNSDEEFCMDCQSREHLFDRGRALYEYGSVAPAIYRFKYSGRREYAECFGEQSADLLGDFLRRIHPDALIPIPLHKNRLKKRGYNQAELLARAISRKTGIPVCTDLLLRAKDTVPMKKLSYRERQNNLKKAFIISRNDVELDIAVLIDDIYTTGTTIDEATRVLKAAGVRKVYYLALACGAGI